MSKKLWFRLSLAFVFVSLIVVAVLALTINQAVENQFLNYLQRSENSEFTDRIISGLISYYQEKRSWDGLEVALPGSGAGGQGQGQSQGQENQRGGITYLVIDPNGDVLYDSEDEQQGMNIPPSQRTAALRVEVDRETVAWVLAESPGQSNLTEIQAEFLEQVDRTLISIALLAVLVALIIGLIFSRAISLPLAALSEVAEKVAAGGLGELVDQQSTTREIESLRQSFNHMSQALAKNEDQRRQMTGDIAHELRTPVSMIRTQLQAMMDGLHELSLENVALAYDQSIHLGRLIEDLRTLTRAESGQLPLEFTTFKPAEMLLNILHGFEPLAQDAGFSLEAAIPGDLPEIDADENRVRQVLANLLTNALNHTPPNGSITLAAQLLEDFIQFTVTNTGATLTEEEGGKVFQRFWRADYSRQRDSGGSGLGLAISQELVHLHRGKIWVELGQANTSFHFTIPLL